LWFINYSFVYFFNPGFVKELLKEEETVKKKIVQLAVLFVMLWAVPALAGSQENLEAKIDALIKQNQALAERLATVEEELAAIKGSRIAAAEEEPAMGGEGPSVAKEEFSHITGGGQVAPEEKTETVEEEGEEGKLCLTAHNKRLELNGLIEVEAAAGKNFNKEDTSDVTLATAAIGLDAKVSEWTTGHLILLYEEGEEDNHIIIDEGTATLGNLDRFPLFLSAGRMYVPFGSYENNMISDPLTLEIGETRQTALQLGFVKDGFAGSVYAFNGDINETGKDDTIREYGANIAYTHEEEKWGLNLGLDWTDNIGASKTLEAYLTDNTPGTVSDFPGGLAVHGALRCGQWSFLAEYLTALDSFKLGEVDFNGQGAEPSALMTEIAYFTDVVGRKVSLAFGYQRTDEALALELPESRYIGTVRAWILSNTAVSLEYAHDKDYSIEKGGTDENAHTATMQVAVEF